MVLKRRGLVVFDLNERKLLKIQKENIFHLAFWSSCTSLCSFLLSLSSSSSLLCWCPQVAAREASSPKMRLAVPPGFHKGAALAGEKKNVKFFYNNNAQNKN